MNNKKPCIIISERCSGRTFYKAISEHCGHFATSGSYITITDILETYGWQIMPLNSRFARTILDKLEGHRV